MLLLQGSVVTVALWAHQESAGVSYSHNVHVFVKMLKIVTMTMQLLCLQIVTSLKMVATKV